MRDILKDPDVRRVRQQIINQGTADMMIQLGGSWAVGEHATHAGSDVDFVVFDPMSTLVRLVTDVGFEVVPEHPGEYDLHNTVALKRDNVNVVFVTDRLLYGRFEVAIHMCKYYNAITRDERVCIHKAVIDGVDSFWGLKSKEITNDYR